MNRVARLALVMAFLAILVVAFWSLVNALPRQTFQGPDAYLSTEWTPRAWIPAGARIPAEDGRSRLLRGPGEGAIGLAPVLVTLLAAPLVLVVLALSMIWVKRTDV
jgi:hypothetical protein